MNTLSVMAAAYTSLPKKSESCRIPHDLIDQRGETGEEEHARNEKDERAPPVTGSPRCNGRVGVVGGQAMLPVQFTIGASFHASGPVRDVFGCPGARDFCRRNTMREYWMSPFFSRKRISDNCTGICAATVARAARPRAQNV